MVEFMSWVGGNEFGEKVVVNVPVPKSESSGIWISDIETSGLVFGCWCFISGTLNFPQCERAGAAYSDQSSS